MKKQIHKLIIITRKDISSGYQAVQSGHAAIQFQHEHPQEAKDWFSNSNYLIFLAAKDESELISYAQKAADRGIKISIFREPDLNNEITAIALDPSEASTKLVSNLPLALKEGRLAA